jgi:hypothetical protein
LLLFKLSKKPKILRTEIKCIHHPQAKKLTPVGATALVASIHRIAGAPQAVILAGVGIETARLSMNA